MSQLTMLTDGLRRHGARLAGCLATVAVLVSGAPSASAAACRPLDAAFYSTDSMRLAQRLALNPSACADYYISVTPGGADGTVVRTGVAPAIRSNGPQFHAMAEIRFSAVSWGSWVAANGKTWFDAGVEARKRMDAAGYDVSKGDTWALNELSPDVIANVGSARADALEFIRGLYTGDGTPSKGLVFVTVPFHATTDLAQYKQQLQDWLQDTSFWEDMSRYVHFWGEEVYADSRDWGVAGSSLTQRADSLNDYLQHLIRLVQAGPGTTAAAQSFLRSAYTPIANGAWSYATAFGNTMISALQMENFISTETYAMRWSSAAGSSDVRDRFGFAWSPKNNLGLPAATFTAQSVELLDRLAGALHGSESGADGACGSSFEWCDSTVDGAAFNDAWKAFTEWSPPTNTRSGTDVRVDASAGVTVTYASVTSGGNTHATTSDDGPPPPDGFAREPGAPYFDITTTTVHDGPIDVCVDYGAADYSGVTPRLFHLADGTWQDVTTTLDRSGNVVCGRTTSLSTFAVFAAPPPTLTVPAAIAVDATGPAGASVEYAATATSLFDPSPVVECVPRSGSLFPIGDTTVTCTATDGGGTTMTATFAVHVADAVEQLEHVAAEIVTFTGLAPGLKAALLARVDKVIEQLNAANPLQVPSACISLATVVPLVHAAQSTGAISAAEAATLVADMTRIRAVPAC
jgi:hypothetical protein